MKSLARVFEWTLNGLAVLAGVVIIYALTNQYLGSGTGVAEPLRHGAHVRIAGIEWGKNKDTLILAISPNCRFCTASASFYRDLVQSDLNHKVRLVAVASQQTSDVQLYLRLMNINILDAIQTDFDALGVESTPTLILADDKGRVKATWAGKLESTQENEVFRALDLRRISAKVSEDDHSNTISTLVRNDPTFIDPAEAAKMSRVEGGLPIIDIRPREAFDKRHLRESISMPVDEIEARAPHELPADADLILYCAYSPPCERTMKSQGIATTCNLGRSELRRLGFTRTRFLIYDFSQLTQAGLAITGASSVLDQNSGNSTE